LRPVVLAPINSRMYSKSATSFFGIAFLWRTRQLEAIPNWLQNECATKRFVPYNFCVFFLSSTRSFRKRGGGGAALTLRAPPEAGRATCLRVCENTFEFFQNTAPNRIFRRSRLGGSAREGARRASNRARATQPKAAGRKRRRNTQKL